MTYRVIILVDGVRAGGYREVHTQDLEYFTELSGPNLHDFSVALKLTGKAMDVERTPDGVRVVIAHEEI
jgi:hypothetical protein